MAFIIYCKNIGGRKFDRYYHKWENAKEMLMSDLNDLVNSGCKITSHRDRMNVAKGYYEFDYTLITDEGETACLTLMNGYFGDE